MFLFPKHVLLKIIFIQKVNTQSLTIKKMKVIYEKKMALSICKKLLSSDHLGTYAGPSAPFYVANIEKIHVLFFN